MGVDAEVLGLTVVDGGHHIPCGPSARQVIQAGERPRDVERLVVRRRIGGAEADVRCRLGEYAEDDAEVEFDRARAVSDRFGDRTAVDAGHRKSVVEEHQIEAAFLQLPPDFGVVRRVEIAVFGGGVAPGSGIHGGASRLHESNERHLVGATLTHALQSNT